MDFAEKQILKTKLRNIFMHGLGVDWMPEQVQWFENNVDNLMEKHMKSMKIKKT